MDRLPRVTDLVPRRMIPLSLALLAGLAIVAGFEALYYLMPHWAAGTTDGRIAAFDLDSEGSLATWFSSTTLFAASAMAWLVYLIRRHQPDDYHGRYRVWLWAAACWMLMSVDEGASLHEGFKELMTQLTGQRIMGDGSFWWVAAYTLLLGAVGTRLLFEMYRCISSTLTLGAAASCYVVAVVVQMELFLPQQGSFGVMIEEGCEMCGNLLLLLAMTLHAGFVIQEVEDGPRGKSRKSEDKKTRKSKPDDESTPVRRSDLASPAKPAAPLASKLAGVSRVDGAQRPAPATDPQRLSKAERRAMRRQGQH